MRRLECGHVCSALRPVSTVVFLNVLILPQEASNTLQRAENAAVRGLWRRQDEVKRMTLELHDPLVEEAAGQRGPKAISS